MTTDDYTKADKEVNHPQVPTARGRLSPEDKARIEAEEKARIEAEEWVEVIMTMTGAQIRAAKAELRLVRDVARAMLREDGYVPVTTEDGEWVRPEDTERVE